MKDIYVSKSDEDLMSLLVNDDSLALETLFDRYYRPYVSSLPFTYEIVDPHLSAMTQQHGKSLLKQLL